LANKLENAYHNLALMLEAGVPILKSLRHSGAVAKGRIPRAFNALADHVAEGDSLADAMEKHRRVFVPLDIQMIQVGEESGNLPLMVQELSKSYALCNKLNKTIFAGMAFPLLIIHFVAFLIPTVRYLKSIILGGDVTLGSVLWEMIGILSFLYIPICAIICIIKFTPKTGLLRWLLDAISLRIPFVGYALKHMALSRFTRNFCLCYSAGVEMLRTCQVAMDGCGNVIVASWFKPTLDVVRNGKPVSDGLPVRKLSPDFIASWENGERSGKLAIVTERLASHDAERSEKMFTQISFWLPKIVYGLIAMYMIRQIFLMAAQAFSAAGL